MKVIYKIITLNKEKNGIKKLVFHNNGCCNGGSLIKFRIVDEDINWIGGQWIGDIHSHFVLIKGVSKR